MIKEFSEYPNVEEENYDIKSALASNSNPTNNPNNSPVLDEEIFEEEDTIGEPTPNNTTAHPEEVYTVLEEDDIFDAYPKEKPQDKPEDFEEVIEEEEITPPPIENNPSQEKKPSLEEIIGTMFANGEGDARYNGDDYIDEEIIEGNPERPIVDDIIDDLADNGMSDDAYEGYDFFLDDENIAKTLEKYNHNYARLIKRLTFTLNQMEIEDMINECGIGLAEYENPTPEIFERLRKQVMNGKQHKI